MQLDFFDKQEPVALSPDTMTCYKCGVEQSLDNFIPVAVAAHKDKDSASTRWVSGTARYCKCCREEYARTTAIAKKLAPPKPTGLYACDCCGEMTSGNNLHLDHDHITSAFRGWLCRKCNTGLGTLGDSIEGLERAIDYLKRANERNRLP